MKEGRSGESGATIDCVRVILVLAGHVPYSHFFKGGPAILNNHKQSIIIIAEQAWSVYFSKLNTNHLFYRVILFSFTPTFLAFLSLF